MWWTANLLFSLMVLLLGGCLASFWALVAYRREHRLDWWRGRSQCDHCRRQLAWYDNIPLISYPMLRGRCRACQKKIPLLYWLWEVLLGGWTLLWWWQFCPASVWFDLTNLDVGMRPLLELMGGWWNLTWSLLWWVLGAVLIWTALVDIKTHEIATGWLYLVAGLTLIWSSSHWLTGAWTDTQLTTALVGSLLVGLVFCLIDKVCQCLWHKPGIGRGDTYLIMLLAWWLTPSQLLLMFLLAFWLGAIVGIFYLAVKKDKRDTTLAFLPFINLAFGLSYLYGEPLFTWLLTGW